MTKFDELGLSETALQAVARLGYETPTPVQEQAIPLALEGRDLIAAASTGTGKTAAFLLPTLSTLPRGTRGKRAPRVLVVSPTRELAQQIARTCMQIARKTGHFVTTVFGGTPYGPQINEIRRGTDVLIATPGRLNDLMERDVVDLGRIEVLVLDEADRMLDMGFLPAVTTIVDATPAERQTLLFSATIDRSILGSVGKLLHDPAMVEIAHKGETADTVEQYVIRTQQTLKPALLKALLAEKGAERVIVFARTRSRADATCRRLKRAGYAAEAIHSDRSQNQRRRALDNFASGKTDVIVATDVLARGIDVPDVDHVINFDLPDMPEDYVHRIGRTGRAGEQGYAISFVTRESRRTLAEIEKLIGKEIPLMELETYELDLSLLKKPVRGKGPRKSVGKGARPKGARSGRPASSNRRPERAARGERVRDARPGRAQRADSRNRNAEHAKKRLELKEKRVQTAAKKTAAASSKKRLSGGYDYSKFASASRSTE